MLTAFLASTLMALAMPQDLKEFRDAFALRHGDSPTEKADPAIQKCMDMVMQRIRKDTTASSKSEQVDQIVSYYSRAVAAEESFETSYRSVGASVSWGQGRVAIGVRMGAVSRLRVFSTVDGKPISVPKALDWSYQYDAQPQFLPGGTIVVNGSGIQDAGIRYGYRVLFLKPSPSGFQLAKSIRGVWVLDEEQGSHLATNGVVCTLKTIDSPDAFFTDNATFLFVKETVYDTSQWPYKVRLESLNRATIHAVDQWMAAAIKSPKTPMQKEFVDSYGTERQMIDSFSEKTLSPDSFEVRLKFEKTYVFTVQAKNMSYLVKSMKIED